MRPTESTAGPGKGPTVEVPGLLGKTDAHSVALPSAALDLMLILTAAEFCGVLRVSRATFARLNSTGRIPRPVRLGRRTLWLRSEVVAWTDAGCPNRARWEAMRGRAR